MKKILQYLFEHKTLDREEACEVLTKIGQGVYNEQRSDRVHDGLSDAEYHYRGINGVQGRTP